MLKAREMEKLNWHMQFDEVELDVAGEKKAVILTIIYSDKYKEKERKRKRREAENPNGFLTRMMIPEDIYTKYEDDFPTREDAAKFWIFKRRFVFKRLVVFNIAFLRYFFFLGGFLFYMRYLHLLRYSVLYEASRF